MSHIVKGKVEVTYNDTALLLKALSGVGLVVEDERLYRVGAGYTHERYPLVLVDRQEKQHRIGYKKNKNSVWEQYQEDFGQYGQWTQKVSSLIQDRYIAFHYEKELIDEGFTVTMMQHNDGTIELEAEEMAW